MKSIANTATSFKPPELSPDHDEWVEHNLRIEKDLRHKGNIEKARIPKLFITASLDDCDPRVREYAERISDTSTEWLLLTGHCGRGKTHAACAILHSVLDSHVVRFVTMSEILEAIKGTFTGCEKEADIISRYTHVRVLVLDDFGKEKPTEWALSIIFRIIDTRYSQMRPTIITTQYSGADLLKRLSCDDTETAGAILSRMSEATVIRLEGQDRRKG